MKTKNDLELRGCCQIIQMQLDVAAESYQSDFFKELNNIIRSITPDIKAGIFDDKK